MPAEGFRSRPTSRSPRDSGSRRPAGSARAARSHQARARQSARGGEVEASGCRGGLVVPEHEPAALVARVDVGVDHAGDRKLGPDLADGLGDRELMPRRHDGQSGAEPRRGDPRSRARGVHHHTRRDRAARRPHALDPRAPISNPVAGVCGSSTAPSFSAARQYPIGSSAGSTLQSDGLHVTATIPRSPRIGSRFRASATETKSMVTSAVVPRSTLRARSSASRSVRAILARHSD